MSIKVKCWWDSPIVLRNSFMVTTLHLRCMKGLWMGLCATSVLYHFRFAWLLEVIKLYCYTWNFVSKVEFFEPINTALVKIMNMSWLYIGNISLFKLLFLNSVLLNNIKRKVKRQRFLFKTKLVHRSLPPIKYTLYVMPILKVLWPKIVQPKFEILTPKSYLVISVF